MTSCSRGRAGSRGVASAASRSPPSASTTRSPTASGYRHPHAAGHGRAHRRLQVRPQPARRAACRPGADRRDRQRAASSSCSRTRRAPSARATPCRSRPSGTSLDRLIGEATGRVIVATFASNIGRIQQVVDAAAQHGRKMVALGRSMEQNTAIARGARLPRPARRHAGKKDQLQRLPKEKLVVMTTGSQGEPMSGLTRMSNRDHRNITIEPGDTVIVSASPIPGNEEAVAKTIDNLFKEGAMVHVRADAALPRLRPRLARGAEADARPGQAAAFHPGPRRVPDAGAAWPAGRGCRRADVDKHLRAREWPGGRVRRHAGAAGGQRHRRRGAGRRDRHRSTASTA